MIMSARDARGPEEHDAPNMRPSETTIGKR
jgi:hypothetical protein